MRWAVVTVILAVMQAAPPVPRQTANNPANASSNAKQNTESEQTKAAQSPPANPDQAQPRDAARNGQGNDNAQHSVVVRELPTVTVTPPKKDWADWGYWVFNLGLVLVGAVQVYLLLHTLRAIRRQADQMERQTDKLDESISVARDAADAAKTSAETLKNSERAWIIIGCPMKQRGPLPFGAWNDARYVYDMTNVGKTPARVTETGASFVMLDQLSDLPETMLVEPWQNSMARKFIIAPNEAVPFAVRYKPDARVNEVDMAFIHKAVSPKKFLVAHGYVVYLDAFGDTHETRFIHFYSVPPEDDRFGWEGFCPYADTPEDYYKST